jgi:hypothetical protein
MGGAGLEYERGMTTMTKEFKNAWTDICPVLFNSIRGLIKYNFSIIIQVHPDIDTDMPFKTCSHSSRTHISLLHSSYDVRVTMFGWQVLWGSQSVTAQ